MEFTDAQWLWSLFRFQCWWIDSHQYVLRAAVKADVNIHDVRGCFIEVIGGQHNYKKSHKIQHQPVYYYDFNLLNMILFQHNGFDIQPWRSLSRISSKIFGKFEFWPHFQLSCVHRPFPGDLAINYFDVGMNSTLNRQTGNGRWGAVCGSGLAASALCVNIIYAPLQWHHVNLTLHILTEIKQPFGGNQDESFIHCSNPFSSGDVYHGATWLGDRYWEDRGDCRRQRSSAAMQVQGLKTLFTKKLPFPWY